MTEYTHTHTHTHTAGSWYMEAPLSVEGALVLPYVFMKSARDHLCEYAEWMLPGLEGVFLEKRTPGKLRLPFLSLRGFRSPVPALCRTIKTERKQARTMECFLFPVTSFTILVSVFIKKTGLY